MINTVKDIFPLAAPQIDTMPTSRQIIDLFSNVDYRFLLDDEEVYAAFNDLITAYGYGNADTIAKRRIQLLNSIIEFLIQSHSGPINLTYLVELLGGETPQQAFKRQAASLDIDAKRAFLAQVSSSLMNDKSKLAYLLDWHECLVNRIWAEVEALAEQSYPEDEVFAYLKMELRTLLTSYIGNFLSELSSTCTALDEQISAHAELMKTAPSNMERLSLDPALIYNYDIVAPVGNEVHAKVRDENGNRYLFVFSKYPPMHYYGGTLLPDNFLDDCVSVRHYRDEEMLVEMSLQPYADAKLTTLESVEDLLISDALELEVQSRWVLSRPGYYKFKLVPPRESVEIEVPIKAARFKKYDGGNTLLDLKDWQNLLNSSEAVVYINNEVVKVPERFVEVPSVKEVKKVLSILPTTEAELMQPDVVNDWYAIVVQLLQQVRQVDIHDKALEHFLTNQFTPEYLQPEYLEVSVIFTFQRRVESLLIKLQNTVLLAVVSQLETYSNPMGNTAQELIQRILAILQQGSELFLDSRSAQNVEWVEKLLSYLQTHGGVSKANPAGFSDVFKILVDYKANVLEADYA